MAKSYKQSNPKLSVSLILQHHIISLELIQQNLKGCYCTHEIPQSDGKVIY